jgi:hypothetical protein
MKKLGLLCVAALLTCCAFSSPAAASTYICGLQCCFTGPDGNWTCSEVSAFGPFNNPSTAACRTKCQDAWRAAGQNACTDGTPNWVCQNSPACSDISSGPIYCNS